MVAIRWLLVPQASNCRLKVLGLLQSSTVSNGLQLLMPIAPDGLVNVRVVTWGSWKVHRECCRPLIGTVTWFRTELNTPLRIRTGSLLCGPCLQGTKSVVDGRIAEAVDVLHALV